MTFFGPSSPAVAASARSPLDDEPRFTSTLNRLLTVRSVLHANCRSSAFMNKARMNSTWKSSGKIDGTTPADS